MSFELATVRQSLPFELTGQGASVAVAFASAVAAGSTLAVIGPAVTTDGLAVLLSSVAGGGTWGTPTNTRTAGSYLPNMFAAVAENVSAGSPTITLTLNAANANTNKVSFTLIEIEKCVTASGVDKTVTGTSASSTSTSTAATGALTQTDNLVILGAGGWFGSPTNPSGWANLQNVMNGAYIGSLVCAKNVTSTDSITGTVAHEAAAAASAIMLVIKGASAGGTKRYRFPGFNPAVVDNTVTGIEAHVWRNGPPFSKACERYEGITAGSGEVIIASGLPSDAVVTDSIVAKLFNGTHFSNYVTGVVEVV